MNLPRFLRKQSSKATAPDLDLRARDLIVAEGPRYPIDRIKGRIATGDISRIVASDITGLAAIDLDLGNDIALFDEVAETARDGPFVGEVGAAEEASAAAGPVWDINHVLAYGQSLSNGWDGWPVLSDTPRTDSLMLGRSVHGTNPASSEWQPIGPPEFSPLVATVHIIQATSEDPTVPVFALGETVLETALHLWRGRMLKGGHGTSGHHRLLASSCGVGGQSLEALSKGNSSGYYERLASCAAAGLRAAEASDLTYGITALLLLQGESNSWGGPGITSDRNAFKRMIQRLREDFQADVVTRIARQTRPPIIFTYQTAAAYANESVSIGQAQLELALEDPGFVMVAPAYGLTGTPSGHLDANGYRWLGAHFGRVMHRVLDKGEIWRPLHPMHVATCATELTIAFHVPHPPLLWGHPIPGQTAFEIPDRGFTVSDADGLIPIHSVELASPVSVRIMLSRPPGSRAELRYASKRTYGIGSLCDSDPDVADCVYTFDPTKQGFQANLPDLVGRPYKLTNWCVGFAIPIAAG